MTQPPINLPREKATLKAVLLEGIHPSAVDVLQQGGYTNIVTHAKALTGADLQAALDGAHFVGIRSRTQLTAAVLEQAPQLAAIGCFCIGTNQVDLRAAMRLGIAVFNAPFSNTRSVAELVLAEITMLMRGIPEKNAILHRGGWVKSAAHSFEVRGKVLGIVGYGHIGTQIGVLAERYRYMRDCVVLGRGFSYATAFEFALKMKELTYTIAESYSSADFMHGPLALIEHGFPAFVIAPSGVLLPEMKQFVQTLQQREAEIVAISDDADTLALGRTGIPLPAGVPEWLSPLTAIVPCQLFAMHLAAVRDFDPDHPRGLRKVTETR